jgi:hypothetical protein
MIAAPTTAERDVLGRFGAHVQPDLILVGFCLNDPQPRGQNYSVERERFDGKYKRRFDSLKYRLSLIHLRAFADLLVQAAYGLAEKTGTVPTWDQGLGRTYVESSPEWRAFVEALRDIKRMSDDMRLPAPVFAVLNQSGGTGSDFSHPDELLTKILGWTRQAESAAATAGFKTLNYEKEIPVEIANESTGINEIDRHPSAKLNALYAKKLFAVISDHLALNDKKKLDQAKKQ